MNFRKKYFEHYNKIKVVKDILLSTNSSKFPSILNKKITRTIL